MDSLLRLRQPLAGFDAFHFGRRRIPTPSVAEPIVSRDGSLHRRLPGQRFLHPVSRFPLDASERARSTSARLDSAQQRDALVARRPTSAMTARLSSAPRRSPAGQRAARLPLDCGRRHGRSRCAGRSQVARSSRHSASAATGQWSSATSSLPTAMPSAAFAMARSAGQPPPAARSRTWGRLSRASPRWLPASLRRRRSDRWAGRRFDHGRQHIDQWVHRAFRWTQAGGMTAIGPLPGHQHAAATGVSDNGKIVVGTSSTRAADPRQARRHRRRRVSLDRGDRDQGSRGNCSSTRAST